MKVIARIITKSGKTAAEISQTTKGSLSWAGAWGAGCGSDTWQSVRHCMQHKRGWRITKDHPSLR